MGESDALRPAGDLLDELRGAGDMREKLQILERQSERSEKAFERVLKTCGEKELMADEDLKLVAAWGHHRKGAEGERDYYLYAIDSKEDRTTICREAGVESPPRPERLVMLITVDCTRGDRLSCNGYEKPTTPVIDRLAASGVNFPRAYSTAGQTAQSFPGILMSTLFQNLGKNRGVPSHLTTLGEVMKSEGYHTIAINAANPHISNFYDYDKGFDEYEDYLRKEPLPDGNSFTDDSYGRTAVPGERELDEVLAELERNPQIHSVLKDLTGVSGASLARCIIQRQNFYPCSSADVFQNAMARLERLRKGEKVFCWLHLMDLHENISVPYSPLEGFSSVQQYFLDRCNCLAQQGCVLKGQREKYGRLYDSALSYVDRNIEILHNFLMENDMLRNSLVCITADHGQELFENGRFGHGSDRLNESLLHVPLVFYGGLANSLETCETPVSTLDIGPTILDLCEIGESPERWLGSPLGDSCASPACGQSFYQGADNRAQDLSRREFLLSPFPEPVRDCCAELRCWIERSHMFVEDRGRGESRMERLHAAKVPELGQKTPSAEALKHRLNRYIEQNYALPERRKAKQLSRPERDIVTSQLEALGYL